MANPRNLSVHPAAGVPLPPQWRQQAGVRAAQADAEYLAHLQNAWKRPAQTGAQASVPAIQACRLTADSARNDSELKLVGINSDGFEILEDSHGRTVKRRRK